MNKVKNEIPLKEICKSRNLLWGNYFFAVEEETEKRKKIKKVLAF